MSALRSHADGCGDVVIFIRFSGVFGYETGGGDFEQRERFLRNASLRDTEQAFLQMQHFTVRHGRRTRPCFSSV